MSVYNPETDGVRETSSPSRSYYRAQAWEHIQHYDVDTLITIVQRGDREFRRVFRAIYGANGFDFTNEEIFALFKAVEGLAWDKFLAERAHDERFQHLYRSTLTPAQQMLEYEKARAQLRREATAWNAA